MLTELPASRAALLPSVLNAGEDLPNCVEKMLVVCSNHCFQSYHVCHSLLRADYLRSRIITIVQEEGYKCSAARLLADHTHTHTDLYGAPKDVLTELLASRAELIPSVLNAGEDLPTYAEKVLVVCSNHCFQSYHF